MSISVDVVKTSGGKAGKVDLPEALFGRSVNIPLIHQVVVAQLAAARQGTHATKTRGEVSGGGIKPWRQKGTGRARQGSRRAPQWAGGGTVFGPTPRSYAQRTPKKMIQAALQSALSDRVADSKLFVIDTVIDGDVPSTKTALQALDKVTDFRTAMVVLHRDEDVAWLSLRNAPEIHAIAVDQLNVYDVVNNEVIIFTQAAMNEYLARYGQVEQEAVAEEVPVKAEKPAKKAKADEVEIEETPAEVVEETPAEVEEAPKAKKPKTAKATDVAEATDAKEGKSK